MRHWCNGIVLDFNCGYGYGTYLVSKNPNVEKILGIDNRKYMIKWAKRKLKNNKIEFIPLLTNIHHYFDKDINTIICLNIEMIGCLEIISELVKKLNIEKIILSFSIREINNTDIIKKFPSYSIIEDILFYGELKILLIKKNEMGEYICLSYLKNIGII